MNVELKRLLSKEKEEEIIVQLDYERYLKTLTDYLSDNGEIKNSEEKINLKIQRII